MYSWGKQGGVAIALGVSRVMCVARGASNVTGKQQIFSYTVNKHGDG